MSNVKGWITPLFSNALGITSQSARNAWNLAVHALRSVAQHLRRLTVTFAVASVASCWAAASVVSVILAVCEFLSGWDFVVFRWLIIGSALVYTVLLAPVVSLTLSFLAFLSAVETADSLRVRSRSSPGNARNNKKKIRRLLRLRLRDNPGAVRALLR